MNSDVQRESWDTYFMKLADLVATRSKDPSTKIGAVIVGHGNRIRSTGYNDFPSGVLETDSRRSVREQKLMHTEHAERNAIYGAVKSGICTQDCRIYVSGMLPCAECARAIIQSGIKEVIVRDVSAPLPDHWRKSILAGLAMFAEAKIDVREIRETD